MDTMSLFAGVGGTCLAFKNAGFTITVANERDKYACQTYRANFPKTHLIEGDIDDNMDELMSYDVDTIIAGFPCQPYSLAGRRKGSEDARGKYIDNIIKLASKRRVCCVFLENVAGLLSIESGRVFEELKSELNKLGYNVAHTMVNSHTEGYSIQMRKRLYIVATRGFTMTFPDINSFRDKKCSPMRTIDFSLDIKELEYTPDKYPVFFASHPELLSENTETGVFYQSRYSKTRCTNRCPTLTANMGQGGHNVPLIKTTSGNLRRLSPRECFDLMTFPKDFILPDISNSQLYTQAGNSVVIGVVERIARVLGHLCDNFL